MLQIKLKIKWGKGGETLCNLYLLLLLSIIFYGNGRIAKQERSYTYAENLWLLPMLNQ